MAKQERCQANNPATCRVHGTGAAIDAINNVLITSEHLSSNARLTLMEMKDAAKNPDQNRPAKGLTVSYDDGTTEVFYGTATDPYHNTDFQFTSVETYETISGISYDKNKSDDYDMVEQGPLSVKDYQKEFETAPDAHLLFRDEEGTPTVDSARKVIRVIVV